MDARSSKRALIAFFIGCALGLAVFIAILGLSSGGLKLLDAPAIRYGLAAFVLGCGLIGVGKALNWGRVPHD